MINFHGKNQTISEVARQLGIHDSALRWRIKKHGLDKALKMPPPDHLLIEWRGESKTCHQWARHLKIDPDTLRKRFLAGFTVERALTKEANTSRHGHTHTPIYRVWSAMKDRATNPNHPQAKDYVLRGIGVCDRWLTFTNFLEDMGERPEGDNWTLDRLDNSKGYSPDNCAWVTRKQNQNNMRSNHLVTYRGETKSMSVWAQELGMNKCTLHYRIVRGWDVDRAFNQPTQKSK